MANEKMNLQKASSAITELFVQDILSKNGINKINKINLSDEQKAHLKKVVLDLQAQVDEFVKGDKVKEEERETPEKLTQTLREMIKNRKKDK